MFRVYQNSREIRARMKKIRAFVPRNSCTNEKIRAFVHENSARKSCTKIVHENRARNSCTNLFVISNPGPNQGLYNARKNIIPLDFVEKNLKFRKICHLSIVRPRCIFQLVHFDPLQNREKKV